MFKLPLYLLVIFLISQDSFAFSRDENDTTGTTSMKDQLNEYRSEIQRMKQDGKDIHDQFQILELMIVEETYDHLSEQILMAENILEVLEQNESTTRKNDFYNAYESTLNTYNELVNLYDFYRQLEEKKEEWSNEYFRLWEQTYALRTRIDKMYVKEEKMNVHYGGMSDYKYQSVRKRNIYEACINIYNSSLLDLKSTGDCDHYERIIVLNRLLPVMRKCEKLSFEEDTRELERDLRKEEDLQKMAQQILNFEAGEE